MHPVLCCAPAVGLGGGFGGGSLGQAQAQAQAQSKYSLPWWLEGSLALFLLLSELVALLAHPWTSNACPCPLTATHCVKCVVIACVAGTPQHAKRCVSLACTLTVSLCCDSLSLHSTDAVQVLQGAWGCQVVLYMYVTRLSCLLQD